MLQQEILVRETLGSVDASRPRAIAVEEVTALAHEVGDLFLLFFVSFLSEHSSPANFVSCLFLTSLTYENKSKERGKKRRERGAKEEKKKTYNPMELAPLIPLRPTEVVLALARAELTKVLGRLGDYVREQLEGDAAEGLTAEGDVEEDSVFDDELVYIDGLDIGSK